METQSIYVRPNAADGLWCSTLIPISLLATNYRNSDTDTHLVVLLLSIILLIELYYYSQKWTNGGDSHSFHYGVPAASIIGVIILYKLTDYRLMTIVLTVFAAPKVFDYLLKIILSKCTCCFTIGEAAIVAQSATLFIALCLLCLEEFRRKGKKSPEELEQCTKFMQVLLLGDIAVIFVLQQFRFWRQTHAFYTLCAFIGTAMIFVWVAYLGQNPVMWLLYTCIHSYKRILLILSWIGLVMASGLFVAFSHKLVSNPSSAVLRKYFHIVIISTYIPGFLLDVNFLYLSSAVALTIFAVLETCRVLEIPPLGQMLKEGFSAFVDEKDSGILILSHVYLLIGCSCPLWLYPPQNGLHLSHWSGIISVGLGDMVAAAAGSAFGRHRWPDSKKTIEGTVSAVIAQSVALCAILHWGEMLTSKNVALSIFAAIVTSMTEAKTEQNDNLVLPFVMFPILSFIS